MKLILLSLISGVLTGLAFDFPWSAFLIWFSLIPFLQAISKSSFKQGFLAALSFGLAYNLTVVHWIAQVTFLGLFTLVVYLSLFSVIFFLAARWFLKKPLTIISLPCLWVITEFLKENIWIGFGWANLGYCQYNKLHLIQAADLGGVKLISFLIVLANVFIWETGNFLVQKEKLSREKSLIVKKVFLVILIFAAAFVYSFYRLDSLKETRSIKVSLVQPNIPQELKWQPPAASSIIDTLKVLGKATDKDSLVIFPEAAWPQVVKDGGMSDILDFVYDINRELLIGTLLEEKGKFYNAALLFRKDENGKLTIDSYRKVKLVPFGEYVPLRNFFSFISVLNVIGDISPGKDLSVFSHQDASFSTLICFEDVLPVYVSQLSGTNDFLVNITNDAWFGGNPQSRQHLAILAFRAVENRIPIVRSANTGISGWVSFKGQISIFRNQSREVFFSGVETFRVSVYNKRSLYFASGELLPLFCGIFLIGISIKDGLIREA
ncbi:MAG: apolipoprotein N-acyltransferase [Candidatus Omnitrophica bacterium]|nr:apolipoprotein N-acyltransferase [Candidatus Omnitrophota bacterium]